MSSHLTYRPHEGIVFGVVAGRPTRLATLPNPAGIALEAWRTASRTGGAAAEPRNSTHWEHIRPLCGRIRPALRRGQAGGGQANHRHHAHVVLVKSGWRQGSSIHGLPACGDPRCIVVVQGWDSLFTALKATRQVSIVFEL